MKELLKRYLQGDICEEEKARILHWLEESPENRKEYAALRKLYDISLWSGKTSEFRRKPVRTSWRRTAYQLMKIAAIWIFGFLGAWLLSEHAPQTSHTQTIHVPAGQRAELTLSDGTKVWLNSRSTLTFPDHFEAHARQVTLDGEGYFTVARDTKAPFTVQTEKYAIRVLGTEFNVKAYRDSPLFETALLKGSVEISASGHDAALRLKPDEIASTRNGRLVTSRIPDYAYFKWKEGIFCFENETIENLIEKMQLYYDVKIEVRQPSLLPHRYSGKFRIKDGIEHVLKVLQLKHKFTYTKDESLNLIVIK